MIQHEVSRLFDENSDNHTEFAVNTNTHSKNSNDIGSAGADVSANAEEPANNTVTTHLTDGFQQLLLAEAVGELEGYEETASTADTSEAKRIYNRKMRLFFQGKQSVQTQSSF